MAYPASIRREAERHFAKGFGYKATATIMGLPTTTVRDWKRTWKKDGKGELSPKFDDVLKTCMQEKNTRYLTRLDEDLLVEAYRRANGNSKLHHYILMRMMQIVMASSLFERLPVRVKSKKSNGDFIVFRLTDDGGAAGVFAVAAD